jgi:hypothetical protein
MRSVRRYDECVRRTVLLEIELFGKVLSTSLQQDCEHQPETFVRMFGYTTRDGRRGEHYTGCGRCRLRLSPEVPAVPLGWQTAP